MARPNTIHRGPQNAKRAAKMRRLRDVEHKTYAQIARYYALSRQRVWQILNPKPTTHA